VSRKITRAVGRIKAGLQKELFLGNLDALRDWGYAPEYVEAMWRMLQQQRAEDFVIGTGETHSVREFLDLAFGQAGLDWKDFVKLDPRYLRPAEVEILRADPSKAERVLGWRAQVKLPELVRKMVEADLELAEREKHAR
jgi:GDPmannose 4,6-dehydratase